MPILREITNQLGRIAPLQSAADWDNVGLLLGDVDRPVERILTCLTLTPDIATEAVSTQRQLIVSHHPILFRGVKRLTTATAEGRSLLELARHGIAVYSAHTAYDNAPGGINEQLAQQFELVDARPLRPFQGPSFSKIVAFVPAGDLDAVRDAMFGAGAGRIGRYRECGFRVTGTGSFLGEPESNPTVGLPGRREEVPEHRLESVCPNAAVTGVLAAMKAAHSYEEPAFDVYALSRTAGDGGEGRIGRLPSPIPLQSFAELVRDRLKAGRVGVVGNPQRPVQAVALACGAAGEFLDDAVRCGADVFVTGELRFHTMLEVEAHGIGAIVAGHYATERFAMESLAHWLRSTFPDCDVVASQRERDPCRWV